MAKGGREFAWLALALAIAHHSDIFVLFSNPIFSLRWLRMRSLGAARRMDQLEQVLVAQVIVKKARGPRSSLGPRFELRWYATTSESEPHG